MIIYSKECNFAVYDFLVIRSRCLSKIFFIMKYLIYFFAITLTCCFIACSTEEMPIEDQSNLNLEISSRSSSLCPDPATWTSSFGNCTSPLPSSNVKVRTTSQGNTCRVGVSINGLVGIGEYCVYDATNGNILACGTLPTGSNSTTSANFNFQTNSQNDFVISVSGLAGAQCYSELFTPC